MSNIGSDNMENTRMIYVPQALTVKRRGDPKQLAGDWKEHIEEFRTFPRVSHNKPEIAGTMCAGCRNAKVLLRLVGSAEVRMLRDLAGRVMDTDSWEVTLTNILRGIISQSDQVK